MNDDKTQLAISRAARAKALLNDDLLLEAFAGLETAYMDKWRTTHALDTESREKLFLAVNVLGMVRQNLQTIIDNGKIAQADLDALLGRRAA